MELPDVSQLTIDSNLSSKSPSSNPAVPNASSSNPTGDTTTGAHTNSGPVATADSKITLVQYSTEEHLSLITKLIETDLSEPYTIYTYRYFLVQWPQLSFLAMIDNVCVGVIVCKLEMHKNNRNRGYLAMLAVKTEYRKRGIGSMLIQRAVQAMQAENADEVVLETEITNKSAQSLYENLGFIRDKRMARYYLNGNDAYRLKLLLK